MRGFCIVSLHENNGRKLQVSVLDCIKLDLSSSIHFNLESSRNTIPDMTSGKKQ